MLISATSRRPAFSQIKITARFVALVRLFQAMEKPGAFKIEASTRVAASTGKKTNIEKLEFSREQILSCDFACFRPSSCTAEPALSEGPIALVSTIAIDAPIVATTA
ncbi:hypothetical protein [Neorhizobium tomejilense]|uniref:hypothetical protein n=1 Tax=Neorhizobium tomejilense TaxID=2093828 RepID=UPI000CF90584|nr:hypothetical protein [Neorhizobium tomejilense]